jgi:hypothetical protein
LLLLKSCCAVKKGDSIAITVPGLSGALIGVSKFTLEVTFFLSFASESFGGFCSTSGGFLAGALLLLPKHVRHGGLYRKTSNIINLSNQRAHKKN